MAPLVIVDYLQDLARGADDRSIRSRVGDIVTALRALAQECDCPLIAVSSVSRAYYSEKRREEMRALKDATAYLTAAKESGDVDYASVAVLFLDVEPQGTTPHRLAQIAVAKSRHGETGFAGARFYGASGRWEADAGAVEALGDEARADARQEGRNRRSEDKVLAAIRKHPQATWRNLQKSCGVSPYSEADAARDRLVAAERIVSVTESYFDALGRTQKRAVWRVVGDPPPADTVEALAAKHGIGPARTV